MVDGLPLEVDLLRVAASLERLSFRRHPKLCLRFHHQQRRALCSLPTPRLLHVVVFIVKFVIAVSGLDLAGYHRHNSNWDSRQVYRSEYRYTHCCLMCPRKFRRSVTVLDTSTILLYFQ